MEKIRLGDACEILNGFAFKSENYVDSGIRVIRIANVQKGYIEDNTPAFYPLDSVELDKYMLEEGDLLISLTGNVGRVAILEKEFLPAALNQRVACLRLKTSRLTKGYLFHILNGNLFEQQCIQSSKGVAQKNMSTEWLKNYEIPLYSKEKQDVITEILDKTYNVIFCRQQEIQKLDDLIKARFVEMFGSIHDGRYDMKTLPEIVNDDKNSIKRGPFGGALKKDDFVEDGYLVYEQRHAIHNDFEYAKYYITQEKYEDMIGFKVIPGDLIISCSGVTLGRIAEVPEGAKEGIINQALLKLSLNPEVMLNTFFIQQFRGEEIQEILFGFSRGSGIPNMPSMSEVKAVKFICPPLELQKQYCDFVNQVDKSKVVVQKALEKTQLLFDSLMQQYFG